MLTALLIAALIGVAIGAVILRLAIAMFNRIRGSQGTPDAVPGPPMSIAMIIVFVSWLVNFFVGYVAQFVLAAALADQTQRTQLIITNLASLPLSFLVNSGMLSALLPTSFGKAMAVAFFEYVVWILIIAGILGVMFAIGALSLM